MCPSAPLTLASSAKMSAATGAVPYVVSRLYWLACSSLSGGTRFGTEASLAGVQNSEAQEARNCTPYIQVSLLTKPNDRSRGMDRKSNPRTTSPMIIFKRRSIRSAAAPASGPRTSAGSSEDSQTPPTAAPCAESPFPARASASEVRATRLSQSPRLDSDVAIHSRRNGLMDSTPSCPFDGDRKFTAPGYPHRPLHVGGRLANVRTCRPLSSRYEPVLAPAILAPAVF